MLLFFVTVASVFLTGAMPHHLGGDLAVRDGLLLVVSLLSILFAHEMGHYLMCRRYGVDATLPYFIPSPWLPLFPQPLPVSLVGTFGAFIKIRSPFPDRKALFDVGIAGPLAGFVVCLPVLVLGVLEARVVAVPVGPPGASGSIQFGEPLLFRWAVHLLRGNLPAGHTLEIGSLGLAAWFGLFITAINLIPVGQLDGGHTAYALLRERARPVSRLCFLLSLILVYQRPTWLLWAVILFLLDRRGHPPTLHESRPPGRARIAVGILGALVFAVSFTPTPIVVSWADFLGDLAGVLQGLRGFF